VLRNPTEHSHFSLFKQLEFQTSLQYVEQALFLGAKKETNHSSYTRPCMLSSLRAQKAGVAGIRIYRFAWGRETEGLSHSTKPWTVRFIATWVEWIRRLVAGLQDCLRHVKDVQFRIMIWIGKLQYKDLRPDKICQAAIHVTHVHV
jgi:hypothetical protein